MGKLIAKNSEVWVEENILMLKFWGKIGEEDVGIIIKNTETLAIKMKGKKYMAVDLSDVTAVNLAARKITTSWFAGFVKKAQLEKVAGICKNPLSRMIAMFYLKLKKVEIPVNILSSKEEAKKWLKKQ